VYRILFDLAGYAIFGWLLLILLPSWRITRRIAESAVFPVWLSALYVVGLVAVMREMGPGFMASFGSADGVLGLLAQEPIALVAWIHILAFDQVVALLIYRDNMRHRFVPVPLQSVIMVATLMLGPVGFISYWLVRTARSRTATAWGEAAPDGEADVPAPRFADVVAGRRPAAAVMAIWQRERELFGLAALGFTLAGVTGAIAAVNGGWLLGAEGRLLEAVKFDVATGIYYLSLALVLPFAPISAAARTRWMRWAVAMGVFGLAMENVQAWRGLDPRFSTVAGPLDQILGGVFFLSAMGILVLFVDLLARFFRDDAIPDHPALRTALRYAGAAAMFGFGIGVVMSMEGGRLLGAAGNMMPLHAAGFHGLQTIPLVALLGGAARSARSEVRTAVHTAGMGWLLLCAGLFLQPLLGQAITEPGAGLLLAAAGAVLWGAGLAQAVRAGSMAAPAAA
jgi:uncharacterized membrane protein YidH (DUF202 family)